jgi:ubiquinol-cytochrome c reductase cytochrome b subunit
MGRLSKYRGWVKDRLALQPIQENALERRVAKGSWYFGDGATLVLLLAVLVATGVAMTFTYSPSLEGAYPSVEHITYHQTLGWFIRALHYWSAGMMVVMLIWHLLRQILLGGYKFPREGTWFMGVGLFFAVLVMSLTGYMLRWDERALYALRVALNHFYNIPWIGETLVVLIQGDIQPGARTLTRLYSIHVILVPLLILGLVSWHLYLVVVHGVTSKQERRQAVTSVEEQRRLYREQSESDKDGELFFPDTAVKSGTFAAVVFGIVVVLALTLGPAPLMPEANQVSTSFPAEEWWWWWYSSLIALVPSWLSSSFTVLFPLTILVVMILLPFIDRGPARGMRNRPVALGFVVLVVLSLMGLSGLRLQSPWTGWPDPNPPPVPRGVVLTEGAELGRQLFAAKGCNSCHAVSGVGPRVAVDLATLDRVRGPISRQELVRYIRNPPDGVAMPTYQERLTEEELIRLVEYVLVAQTFPRER